MSNASNMAPGVAATVKDIVASKFESSQAYAASAWSAAQTSLSALQSLILHPAIDSTIDVPFNYDGDDIVIGSHGDKPEKPDIDTTFDFEKPVLGTMKELPEFSYLTSSIDEAREDIISRIINTLVEGATGLDPTVEAMIWERARSRQELENARQYAESETYFAARGYELPPGALAGRLQEIAIEIARNNSYLNNDITVEQAKLAQTNSQFIIDKGASVVIEMMKSSISSVLDYNKGTIETFSGEVERYKSDISGKISEIEGKTKVYISESEVYKAGASVDNADIAAKVEINKLKMEEAKTQANIDLKEAEMELDAATKVFTLQVEAMKANTQILSQITASALSGVNASASMGFSGGASLSESSGYSWSWDETKSTPTYSNSRSLSA